MKKIGIVTTIILVTILMSCNTDKSKPKAENQETNYTEKKTDPQAKYLKPFKTDLPTIGLLMYNGVLQGEVIATSDVFAKPTIDKEQIFNVITIAETENPIITEEGIRIVPDYSFENCPKLTALFIPSAYDMYAQVHNDKIVDFIKEKNNETKYIVSNCAGAQLIGKSGIADGHKIVTWIGGGKQLQKDYPNLKVQNDSLVTFVEDGKFSSSNGNLASYVSALNLLEKMTSREHKEFVISYLYLDRLQDWSN
ncbi:transcriptional regulator GlxA family with amidase domain [Aquimarina sp. EL_43]|uniref:DJ-1/PfpI family protein n=1 Tax=Aquimarina TaxID=290174 RepID=UPI00046FDEC4|nr:MULTISPECIES: DJ-1/PfpI family protein [Aquimarina]MBG6133379.1 transcriptional regulator GlxA family with amidase domain [Aquimarina sp. EL_35]MBG6153442.1 transcriptional regulator GlxA family with amidase domain [Aquimarina sp. EL_32]MBG6171598.1 transcriptional regulator GlxA family with amidase domain [Aquimarina sp. EL_43]